MRDSGFDYIQNIAAATPRPKLDDFKDVFGEELVERDKARVVGAKANIERINRNQGTESIGGMGEELEYIIDENAELSDWFGDNSFISKTSEYDDLFNGVDAVLEYDMGEGETPERVALCIDTSVAVDDRTVNNKISRNIQKMGMGQATVKYFESKVDDYKGRLEGIIPVVIGVDRNHVNQMMMHLGNKKYFEEHPAQVVFLKEIDMQLEMYSSLHGLSESVTNQITKLRGIMREVLDDKREIQASEGYKKFEREDMAFGMISAVVDAKKAVKKAPAL